MPAAEAAKDIDLGAFKDWIDWERIAINVDTVYGELDANHESANVIDIFGQMAALKYQS